MRTTDKELTKEEIYKLKSEIDKLEDSLEDDTSLPTWSIVLIVVGCYALVRVLA